MVLTDLVSAKRVLQHSVAVANCGYLFFAFLVAGKHYNLIIITLKPPW